MPRPSPRAAVALSCIALVATSSCGGDAEDGQESPRPIPRGKPNIVVIMTDDQPVDTMRAMPLTRRLIGGAGVTFTDSVVSYPLCCPSRATYLTGQYAHNHGVLDNKAPLGGFDRLRGEHTLPVWLHRAGYETAHVGKYLNGYGFPPDQLEIPSGWDRWWSVMARRKTRMYGYPLNENGRRVTYGHRPSDYKTDVLGRIAARYVRHAGPGERPFFLSVTTTAPHTNKAVPEAEPNPVPAPRHRGRFENAELPESPSLGERDASDKPEFISERRSRHGAVLRRKLENTYVGQLAALGAVDELVRRLVRTLRRERELDDTLIVFTSDNGYLRYQHRINGKSAIYEESIRVPLLIRGPGVPRGKRSEQLVDNTDLAPTILQLAGAEADVELDGRSLLDLIRRPDPDRAVLLEILGQRGKPQVHGVRTSRYTYAEYETEERELYDLRRDPFQLESRHDDPASEAIRRRLAARLDELRDCAGESCR